MIPAGGQHGRARRLLQACLLSLLLAGVAQRASAQDRIVSGVRSLGMGGVGVAESDNALAAHDNPAALAFQRGWDLQFPVLYAGTDVQGDVIGEVDDIVDVLAGTDLAELQQALNDGTASNVVLGTVLDLYLYEVPDIGAPGQGGVAQASAGLAYRKGNWGVSFSEMGYGGLDPELDVVTGFALGDNGFDLAIPFPEPDACAGDPFCLGFAQQLIDLAHGELTQAQAEQLVHSADPSSLQQDPRAQQILEGLVEATAQGGVPSLEDNLSGVTIRGILVERATFTYSQLFAGDRLALGVNAHLLRGTTYFRSYGLGELVDGEALLGLVDDLRVNSVTATAPSIDLGLMVRPTPAWSFGVTGSGLNAPEFEFAGNAPSFRFEPRLRAGASWKPAGWVTLAADYDVTATESNLVDHFAYRILNVGAELRAGRSASLRVGAFGNLATAEQPPTYTAGLGLALGGFELALTAARAADDFLVESATFGGDEVRLPARLAVAFQLGWSQDPQRRARRSRRSISGLTQASLGSTLSR